MAELEPVKRPGWRRPSASRSFVTDIGGPPEVLEVPAEPGGRPSPSLAFSRNPDGPRADAFRLLRHRLENANATGPILLSNAGNNEGAAGCAIDLAAAYAELAGARPLVVDGQFRRPEIASTLGIAAAPVCLARQLYGHRDDRWSPWQVALVESLGVAVAPVDPSSGATGISDSRGLGFALTRFAQAGYGPILIAGPPVLEGAQANLLMEICEGAVLVARAKKTRAHDLDAAMDKLAPGRVFGVALVDAPR